MVVTLFLRRLAISSLSSVCMLLRPFSFSAMSYWIMEPVEVMINCSISLSFDLNTACSLWLSKEVTEEFNLLPLA